MIDASKSFTIERLLDAAPEAIWKAWTDADDAAEWWHPNGATTPRDSVEIDARVGGSYVYTMVDDATGNEVVTGGVYREVVPISRLVFTWGAPDADPDDTPIVTVAIKSAGELTRLTFELVGVEGEKGDNYFYDGWASALDSLVDHLGQTAVHG